ncbi:type VI secretion protein IcmF [Brenneria alni]|uniref:Type VI secretion protein IcmF n=1 Tax=Brenneria alni TaxID=71656 RepID=A0A421DMB7_9GAMM|nr:type VI secretion system membrane subunit TssM [Brenneria alni]RLM21875.1 type VI secretion protein IcmF [Brenneria alni]
MLKTIMTFLRQQLPKLKPSWLLVGIVIWIAILILVWWLGPRLPVGEYRPLEAVWARVIFTLLWLWLAFGISAWRVWRRMRQLKAEREEKQLRREDPLREFVDGQQKFLDCWLETLRTHLGAGILYAMPWYLMIGLPGSGKSSLVHRANTANKLNVRLSAELRDHAARQQIDCWVGENAVILDPDGQLLTQPASEREVKGNKHERLWRHLLGWLAENRKRQPLNGIILTLDLAWLSHAAAADRKAYAQLVRVRLLNVVSSLNTRLPFYIVLTKLDMLHGFDVFYRQLDKETRQSLLGVTFSLPAGSDNGWREELDKFWDEWVGHLNDNLSDKMLSQTAQAQRSELFTFVRQLAGLKDYVAEILTEAITQEERKTLLVRGVYASSVYQQGVPIDAFAQAASQRYQLPEPVYPALCGESNAFFVQSLFSNVIFPEAHLAGENRLHNLYRRRRIAIGMSGMMLASVALVAGWHHYYRANEDAGRNVLNKAQAFIAANDVEEKQGFGVGQLPRLNLIREATLSFGNYREKTSPLADLGLYQGDRIGPYVEGTYLQLLQLRFLPAVMQGLQDDLRDAPPSSEKKLSILRVMRMIDDASGRNKALVEQFMAQRWQQAFPGQGEVQEQLMRHLEYALEHTDWHTARQRKEPAAVAAFLPFAEPISAAQRELSKLPLFQRVYQSLVMRANDMLPPDLTIRDEVGPTFDAVFTLRSEAAGFVPRFLTWPGFSEYFVRQDKTLFDLTALDAWVLGLRERVHLSEEDRKEIQRQVNDRYITDYVNQWQKLLASIDVQPMASPEQALDMLTAVTGNDQPFQRVISALGDNTRVRKLSDDGGDPAQIINGRIARPFIPLHDTLNGRGDKAALIQEVNQKLTDLYHYLEQIVNAVEPGQAALKAVQARQSNAFADPVFALQQYARSLPAPLDRWVGQIAEQTSRLTVDLAMSSLNQEWIDKVVTPFNQQLAQRYPFDPTSDKDAPLSEMERFFAPGGTLDGFYQANLKPMVEAGLMASESGSAMQTELLRQFEQAERIRNALFNAQGNLEMHFVLEPIELTANKRRSVLNLDGQLLEYAHGRRQKIPLVWPNAMRDGAESKITLVPDNRERSPRSLGFRGAWAMFRLMDAAALTQTNASSFDMRFPVDGGAMTYRVYTDESHNPFANGLFSQFRLPESLY